MTTGMALVAENIALEPAFNATDKDVLGASETMEVSFIGVPIRVDANVVGTLTIDRILDNKSGSLLEYDLRLLTIIANLVGQTVKLHRLFASDRERLMAEKIRMQKQFGELEQPGHEGKRAHVKGIIGDSPALRGLLEKVALAARSNSTVLLRGDPGPARSWSPRPFTSCRGAPSGRSSSSIAQRSLRQSWNRTVRSRKGCLYQCIQLAQGAL